MRNHLLVLGPEHGSRRPCLELDGKPSKMRMERNKPVEKSQPVKEDNLFKHTGFSGNFPIGSTKNMCSIYFLSGITGIFMSMVNNLCVPPPNYQSSGIPDVI